MKKAFLISGYLSLLGACGQERLRKVLPPEVRVDLHEQRAASKVDVLWVVDNSGSMEVRQENLSRNFNSFIELFSKGAIDFRMAVTTTDIFRDLGQFKGSPRFLSPQTPNLANAFSSRIKVGTGGSPYEAGLAAAQMALERQSQVNAPAQARFEECRLDCQKDKTPLSCAEACAANSGIEFLRPDAYLYLIFVSDEDDESAQDVRFYWRAFETSKGLGNDGTVTTAAIIGDVPSNRCGATPGARYVSLSQLTGGEVGSICDDSFATTLRKLATNAVGLKRKFALSKTPNESTLKVTISYPCNADPAEWAACAQVDTSACLGSPADSVSVECTPVQGGADGWSYEPASEVIYFAGASLPGLRSTVEIEYYEEGQGPE